MKNITITLATLLTCLCAPMHAKADLAPTTGYLKVFSATQEVQWGDGSYYHPRTGYLVYAADGRRVKQVENQTSITSDEPEQVELAPGTYTVRAESEAGYVSRHVTIKPAQLTEVRL